MPDCHPRPSPAANPRADLHAVFDSALPSPAWSHPLHRRVVVALIAVSDWRGWIEEASWLMDAAETARVQRRRVAADRETLALAYGLHRMLLGTILQCNPRDVPLYRDGRGCPRLIADVAHTSLSHADGLIALAVTTAGPVGVDIESTKRAAVLAEIAARVCHPSETAQFATLQEPARGVALLKLWVRKEAVLKAAGVGLAVEMDTFAVANDGTVRLPEPLPQPIQVRLLDGGRDCVVAMAGRPGLAVECAWLRPQMSTQVCAWTHARIPPPMPLLPGEQHAN